ncbi:putative laccase-9 [Miscanthus floridulus]|uniref:putative laccase-9 n=1 Tax=Miscanthus floridulus TaxID=154761 RepID=UPI00345B12B5
MGAVADTPAAAVLLRLLQLAVFLAFGVAAVCPAAQASTVHHYHFLVKRVSVTRLCRQKSILTVNGQFPGPTIRARKGDVVVVNVRNHGDRNITIHWHGVDQPQNPWSDGPEYITQCPIQPGASFAYRVILSQEEGTLWWHAHSGFDRATVQGAIVIRPSRGTTFPFQFQKKPRVEELPPIILGEWWRDDDVNDLLEETKRTGRDVKPSDANTINGEPGDLFPCSARGTTVVAVERGKTYLLRLINAGLTNHMFFAVAGHRLTVVATDARYTKPFATDHVMVAPGQTVDALLDADDRGAGGRCRYYMAARTFASDTTVPFNNSTATAVLEYTRTLRRRGTPRRRPPVFPVATLPAVNDIGAAAAYTTRLRSLASEEHPVDVPARVDERLVVTMAVNLLPCAANTTCSGPGGARLAASLNNASFVNPSAADVLRAYYYRRFRSARGVYEADFPDHPPSAFNFTDPGVRASGLVGAATERGTRVKVLEYGAAVEVVFQDTAVLGMVSHPMHLHGFSFYVVGRGLGNFDERRDPAGYNLADPPLQNTVAVPKAGWAAIRFRANNPGVWFVHCHFDRHMVWGMDTVFIVKDGKAPDAKMMRPPWNMPQC